MLTRFQQSLKQRIQNQYDVELVSQSSVLISNTVEVPSKTTSSLVVDNQNIQAWLRAISVNTPSFVIDTVASFNSLLVEFDDMRVDYHQVISWLSSLSLSSVLEQDLNKHIIEVCYDDLGDQYPNDMRKVEAHTKLSKSDIIELHCGEEYRVFAVGFMPNFAYLGQLPEALATPRLQSPRVRVPAGAVAIADRQAAVYPQVSPGGWHIIGYTKSLTQSAFKNRFIVGDLLSFKTINRNDFLSLGSQAADTNIND